MESLQDQMTHLNVKVDALHEILEQLESQVAGVLSELKVAKEDRSSLSQSGSQFGTTSSGRYSHPNRSYLNGGIEHKDVLADDSYLESDSQSGDRALAPEVQIQRLTAQLTAAYNRIAALEEQLLLKRVH